MKAKRYGIVVHNPNNYATTQYWAGVYRTKRDRDRGVAVVDHGYGSSAAQAKRRATPPGASVSWVSERVPKLPQRRGATSWGRS